MCCAAVIGICMTRHQNYQVSPIEEAVLLIPYSSNSSRFTPTPPFPQQTNKKTQQHKHHHQTKQAKKSNQNNNHHQKQKIK